MIIQKKALYLEGYVWREEKDKQAEHVHLTVGTQTARPLQLSLLSMHMMHFSFEHKTRKTSEQCWLLLGDLQVSWSAVSGASEHRGQMEKLWPGCDWKGDMQTFPTEENEPETRCVSYYSEIAMICNHQWINIKMDKNLFTVEQDWEALQKHLWYRSCNSEV